MRFDINFPTHVTIDLNVRGLLDRDVQRTLEAIHTDIQTLLTQQGTIMVHSLAAKEALAELDKTTDKLADAVGELAASDEAEDQAFRDEIASLKQRIAAGEAVTLEHVTTLEEIATTTRARVTRAKALEEALRAMGKKDDDPIPEVPELPPLDGGGETDAGGGETGTGTDSGATSRRR